MVLLDGSDFPSEKLMLDVAAELRYSETVFVRSDGKKEFTLRYFTPVDEVPLCGHATIAAFGVLFSEGIVGEGAICTNNTKAGVLKVIAGRKIMMQMAVPKIKGPVDGEMLNQLKSDKKYLIDFCKI